MKSIYKNYLYLFWYKDGTVIPISDFVAIHQIYQSAYGDAEIVFKCRPQAEDFMIDPSGTVEVRNECVTVDNPASGELICTITDIKIAVVAVDDMTSLVPTGEELEFILRTTGNVVWEYLVRAVKKYADETG